MQRAVAMMIIEARRTWPTGAAFPIAVEDLNLTLTLNSQKVRFFGKLATAAERDPVYTHIDAPLLRAVNFLLLPDQRLTGKTIGKNFLPVKLSKM